MSYYKITSSQEDSLVLTMISWPHRLIRSILFIASIICLLYYSDPQVQNTYSLALSCFLAGLALYLYTQNHPHRILFSKNKENIYVYAQAYTSIDHAIQLPYTQLHGIGIRHYRSSRNQNARTRWEVALEKRDQSLWVLNSFSSIDKAQYYAQQIAQIGQLPIYTYPLSNDLTASIQEQEQEQEQEGTSVKQNSIDVIETEHSSNDLVSHLTHTPLIETARSSFIHVIATPDQVQVSWIKPTFKSQRIAHLLLCICLCLVSVNLWDETGISLTILSMITGLLSLFFLKIALSKAKVQNITITTEYMEGYVYTGLSRKEVHFKTPLHDIGAISSMMKDTQSSGVFIFSKEQLQKFKRLQSQIDQKQIQELSISVLFDYARMFTTVKKLDVGILNFADILELELILQGYAYQLSGIDIK